MADDFALYGSPNSSSVSSAGGAWVSLGSDGFNRYSYRALTAGDLASGITYGADCCVLIWRGGIKSAALRVTANGYSGTNPLTEAGFTKNAAHVGLAAFSTATGAPSGTPSMTAPTTWTTRGNTTKPTKTAAYDRLGQTYVDGTSFSATFNSVDGNFSVFELMSV